MNPVDPDLSRLRVRWPDQRPAARVIQLETGMEISFGCRPLPELEGAALPQDAEAAPRPAPL